MLYGGISIGLAVFIGSLAFFVSSRKAAGEKGVQAEDAGATSASSKAEVNVEKLLKLVTKRAAQQVGPKLMKASQVKNVLETRIFGFKNKAAGFILDEVYGVVARVLREIEAEEFMLLLDPSAAASANLPPITILLAGLMSPMVLTISLVVHLSQIFLVLIPVLCMCVGALYIDWGTLSACAVPTLSVWAYFQGGIAAILLVSHLATTGQIQMGKASLRKKVDSLQDRLREAVSDGELDLSEIRELFIVSAIILEHALVVEDGLRRSVWRTLIGYGTIAWMLMTVWTFVIVLGWTFVPGVVAFHPSAEAVAGDDYCGASATVFSARLSCVLSLLFLMFNLVSVVQFVSDQLVTSQAYSAAVLGQAKTVDDNSGGLPVVQTLVKAFLLRGNGDSIKDQIAQSYNRKTVLTSQKKELEGQIGALNKRIDAHKADAVALKLAQGDHEDDSDAVEASVMSAMTGGANEAAAGAQDAVAQAQAQAKVLEEQTKRELQAVYQKLLEASTMLQQSDTLRGAFAQAQQLQEAGRQGISDVSLASVQEAAGRLAEQGEQHMQGAVASAQGAVSSTQEAAGHVAAQAEEASSQRKWKMWG